MKTGSARIDLTPAEGSEFYLLGYRSPVRNQPAKGIHDHIYANALLFEEAGEQVFLWSADLLELPDVTADEMKKKLEERYALKRNNIILSVLHDHSSIRDFHPDWPYGKYSQSYHDFLVNSVCDAYEQCRENLRESTCYAGKDIVTGFYSNRNHKGQLADNEVIRIEFRDQNNIPFAGIINWAVHSTVLGADNAYLTGDLAGNTRRKLSVKFGYEPLFLNGAAGDCSNRNDRQGNDFRELERESSGLAEKIGKIPADHPVRTRKPETSFFHYVFDTDMNAYDRYLKKTIEGIQNGSIKPEGNFPPQALIDKCQEQLQTTSHHEDVEAGVVDLGDLRFYVFPGELGSVFGKELKASTTKTALVAGYSNGFHYYYLCKEDYGKSFETIGNPVPPGTPEKIVEKMMETGKKMTS